MAREILVVEDDDAVRETLTEVLEEEGYRVVASSNGEEAIAYLRQRGREPPGLILLDLMMPVMNGLEFLDSYSADTGLPIVPVVVLSANPALSGRKHRKDVVLYLSKPLDRRRLLETVDLWCA